MKLPSPDSFVGMDLSSQCRVWKQDADGAQRRMTNRGKVYQSCSQVINHLEGRTPRLLFAQAFDVDTIPLANSNPLFETRWIDNVVNARDRSYRVLALPRDSDTYGNSADIYSNAVGSTNAVYPDLTPTPTFPDDATYAVFKTFRGAATNAIVQEKISATNALPIVDFACQEDPVVTLDDAYNHDFTFAGMASPGLPIAAGLLEDLRAKFHRLRMNQNRLAACFLGVCTGNARTVLSSSNAMGFCTNSTSYVNVLDQSVTTRTAFSPGISAPGYKAGVGQSNAVGVQIYALAMVGAGNSDGKIKVIGPTHRADNFVELTVGDETATWYSGGPVYLNTEAADTDETTARNKLDVQIVTGAGGTEFISVYTVLAYTLQT